MEVMSIYNKKFCTFNFIVVYKITGKNRANVEEYNKILLKKDFLSILNYIPIN